MMGWHKEEIFFHRKYLAVSKQVIINTIKPIFLGRTGWKSRKRTDSARTIFMNRRLDSTWILFPQNMAPHIGTMNTSPG